MSKNMQDETYSLDKDGSALLNNPISVENVKCNCYSYNGDNNDNGKDQEVVLTPPHE